MKPSTRNIYYRPLILLLCLTALCFTDKAQDVTAAKKPHDIVFVNTWDEALRQAGIQNKYIFVDAYATWCGPCNLLKALTFKNKKAADFYNEHFINVSIDMERGEGLTLAAEWGIQAYPTLIIFDAQGKPVLGTMGYMGAGDLIKFGRQALNK